MCVAERQKECTFVCLCEPVCLIRCVEETTVESLWKMTADDEVCRPSGERSDHRFERLSQRGNKGIYDTSNTVIKTKQGRLRRNLSGAPSSAFTFYFRDRKVFPVPGDHRGQKYERMRGNTEEYCLTGKSVSMCGREVDVMKENKNSNRLNGKKKKREIQFQRLKQNHVCLLISKCN